jgi:hypothetical protein
MSHIWWMVFLISLVSLFDMRVELETIQEEETRHSLQFAPKKISVELEWPKVVFTFHLNLSQARWYFCKIDTN